MRNISQFFTRQTLSYLVYLPRVFTTIQKPVSFLRAYITGNRTAISELNFRNWLRYQIANFDDLGVFYEIFIKKEYGKIPQGDVTIVDIGANNGLFTLYCKSHNPRATIHCYEPVESCATHVRDMAKMNNFTDIHVHQLAVSDSQWEKQFYFSEEITVAASLYESISVWTSQAVTVQTTTLEAIFTDNKIGKIDFLKVDCEGGEYDIFYGATRETLNRCQSITIEYHDIDEEKTGKKLYAHLQNMLWETRKVIYHHHPAHPHNGFITIR